MAGYPSNDAPEALKAAFRAGVASAAGEVRQYDPELEKSEWAIAVAEFERLWPTRAPEACAEPPRLVVGRFVPDTLDGVDALASCALDYCEALIQGLLNQKPERWAEMCAKTANAGAELCKLQEAIADLRGRL